MIKYKIKFEFYTKQQLLFQNAGCGQDTAAEEKYYDNLVLLFGVYIIVDSRFKMSIAEQEYRHDFCAFFQRDNHKLSGALSACGVRWIGNGNMVKQIFVCRRNLRPSALCFGADKAVRYKNAPPFDWIYDIVFHGGFVPCTDYRAIRHLLQKR